MAEEEVTNLVEVVNISSERMKFELDGQLHILQPKERAKIHRVHAVEKQLQKDRDPVPSTIELLTNKKVLPVSDKRARAALGLRDPVRPAPVVVASDDEEGLKEI